LAPKPGLAHHETEAIVGGEIIQCLRVPVLGEITWGADGGVLFDLLGSHDLAWRLAVAMGLAGGLVQVSFALMRPPRLATSG